ncbi:enoyl-CoA hydratase/isomerase family protein [Oceanicola sp. 22II-s10i]|uniref:enoyl-CoA hydratase/isomerase family protein n=1 Tax=Oceanicola sp. 22II-s10i TaxID=1317116 RepID=UPI000B52754C|nr:enoyl-CoA hydratase/isomerase family protein [Oceanicola sp. 22II-s10i]
MTFAQLAIAPEDTKTLRIEKRDGVAVVTFTRPSEQNPLSEELLFELTATLQSLEADRDLHAVILTGEGRSFCAGAQLGVIVHPDGVDSEMQYMLVRAFNRLAQLIRGIDLPVIAAVNGNAVGGGAALALCCDIAIAAESARYYFAFGRVGASSCDMGCSYMLPRVVGSVVARHWMLTGKELDAQEGLKHGLFVDVVPDGELLDAALAIAARIREATPRVAAGATKIATMRGETTEFDACMDYEAFIQTFLFTRDEHKTRLSDLMKKLKKI